MGRIQRKKDPVKKKAQKDLASTVAKQEPDSSVDLRKKQYGTGGGSIAVKPRNNVIDKSMRFLREVKVELKKVTWPTRKQTMGSTVVVIIVVVIISLFLGIVDAGLSSLIRTVLQ